MPKKTTSIEEILSWEKNCRLAAQISNKTTGAKARRLLTYLFSGR